MGHVKLDTCQCLGIGLTTVWPWPGCRWGFRCLRGTWRPREDDTGEAAHVRSGGSGASVYGTGSACAPDTWCRWRICCRRGSGGTWHVCRGWIARGRRTMVQGVVSVPARFADQRHGLMRLCGTCLGLTLRAGAERAWREELPRGMPSPRCSRALARRLGGRVCAGRHWWLPAVGVRGSRGCRCCCRLDYRLVS